jgi:5-methylcytosine-specific restriction endonuclease McrA
MSVTIGKLGVVRLDGDDRKALRLRVFKRDNFRCARCGVPVTWATGEMAHIIGRGRGGSDTDANCECCCRRCHRAEHQPRAVRAKA